MIRLIIATAMLAGMAACASSAPPAAAPRVDSVAVTNAGDEAVASSEATASPSDDESAVEMIEVPPLEKTAAAVPEQRSEMVCHRERVTGSHRFEKICRLRSDMDKTREETHRALRRLDRQSGPSSPSN